MALYDNRVLVSEQPPSFGTTAWQPVQFQVSDDANGVLGITSPVQNQLVDLAADQNYAATDAACASPPSTSDFGTAACFSPKTNTGNAISWTVNLQYATSGGLGPITDNRPTFSTQSGTTHNLQYSNEGGQVQVTASTTASDGSTIKDCVTFYVEGPSGGIPNTAITNQLVTLYPASRS